MRDDVVEYTKTCLTCQKDKQKPLGLLESLLVPSRPWDSVLLDLIISLLKMGDLTSILVVDRFSKYATFIPVRK